MDLDAQIARVAVLRTESRTAREAAQEAARVADSAEDKYREADNALSHEIRLRIDKLDPGK